MKMVDIKIHINGEWLELSVKPDERLIDILRDRLDLTGTKEGCGEGECGACTVNVDGKAVLSCLMLAAQANGCKIQTIEGLQNGPELHPLQKAFVSESAVQCGFCAPGMIMAAKALVDCERDPDEDVVRKHLANNLCRCTGYDRPVKAVLKAAKDMKETINA